MLLLFCFMTVDTFVSMLAYTSLVISIDARNRASVCSLPGGGSGLPGWSTVMRTKRPLSIILNSVRSFPAFLMLRIYLYQTSSYNYWRWHITQRWMNYQIIASLSSSANLSVHFNPVLVYWLTASSNTNKYLVSIMEKQLHKFVISTLKYSSFPIFQMIGSSLPF